MVIGLLPLGRIDIEVKTVDVIIHIIWGGSVIQWFECWIVTNGTGVRLPGPAVLSTENQIKYPLCMWLSCLNTCLTSSVFCE